MLKIACKFIINETNRETCDVDVKPTVTTSDPHNLVYTISLSKSSLKVETLRLSIFIESDKSYYLSSRRVLTELTSAVHPPVPVGRFMVVKTREGIFRLDLPWILLHRLSPRADGFEINTMVRDKNRCGICLWGSHKIIDSPQTYSLNVYCTKLASVEDCIWLEPYPGGAHAAVCLTDHADFDSVEKLRLLSDLFVKNEFRFTKSVFPKSEPTAGKQEPGLDVIDYRKHIEKLYNSGSAIAYHGFGPRKNAPSLAECRHRVSMMSDFNVATWVDHGVGDYLFSRKNVLEDGTLLTDFLAQLGIKNYWSYSDIWNNPFYKLSSWSLRTYSDIVHDLYRGFNSMEKPNMLRCAYLLDHAIKNITGTHELVALRDNPFRMGNWINVYRANKFLSSMKKGPFAIYGRDGIGFTCTSDDIRIFDTVLINHLGMQLTPALIDSLIEESGLLLAHCYLGAQLSYTSGNCFEGQEPELSLNSSFIRNIEYISERQRDHAVISLPFAQLRKELDSFSKSTISGNDDGWIINKPYDCQNVIGGRRQTISHLECSGSKKWYKGDIGYIMVPKSSNITIRYDRC